MDVESLQQIGLTKSESRAYIALLELGTTSVGAIIHQAQISRSKIYDVLNRLMNKGLVGTIRAGKMKKYKAIPAERLKEILAQQHETLVLKEKALASLLPELTQLQPHEETSAELLVGSRAIRAFFDMSLTQNPKKDEILVLGYSQEASLYFHAYFRDYHKERIKRKIPGKVIYDYETWFLKSREKRKYVQQRYLSKGMTMPAFIYTWADSVGTVVFTPQQKFCFVIKNHTVAKSYKNYFNLIWQQAQKTGI